MRALSVKSPWSWALVTHFPGSPIGDKCVENRPWKHDFRGELLIASSRKPEWDALAVLDWIESHTKVRPAKDDPYLRLGCTLGVVEVSGCLDIATYERAITYAEDHRMALHTVIRAVDTGKLKLKEDTPRTQSPWATGPYCFSLENVRRLPPTGTSGHLGLYSIDTIQGMSAEEWIERNAICV
jgi:hypothetical protein